MSMLASAARGIKNIWSNGDDDDDYADDDFADSEEPQTSSSSSKYNASKYSSDKYSADKYAPSYGGGDGSSSRVRSLRSVPIPLRSKEKNIYTLRPKNQEEAAIAADYLKSGSAVVMNLETVDRATAVRIIDFMSGVCYGLEGQGHAMKLGDGIFLFTPAEFEISSDELDYGENRDFFFKSVEGSTSAPQQAVQAKTQPAYAGANASSVASHGSAHAGSASGMTLPSMSTPPAAQHSSPSANTTPSGYATANYAPPVSVMTAPAPTAAAAQPVHDSPAPVAPAAAPSAPAAARVSTLPGSSVYGSGGKAHVLVGGRPASVSSPAPSQAPASQPLYSAGERRSWER